MFGRAPRGRLQTLRHLASGGMGEVFLGTLERAGRTEKVAIKRPHRHLSRQRAWRRQFEREGEISSWLDHPNIVAVRQVGADEDGPYLALEYVDGWSLAQLLAAARMTGQPVPLEVALSVALDVARGLAYAHALRRPGEPLLGLVHRDLTPDNVLLARAGDAKLTDFGLARLTAGNAGSTAPPLRGKYGYLAPELYDGKEANVAADVFALGSTLYELFVQAKPFEGRTEAEIIRATLFVDAVPVRERRPDVPPAVETWISEAVRRDPAQRPPEVSSLESALAGSGESQGAVARYLEKLEAGGQLEAARRPSTAAVGGERHAPRSARIPRLLLAGVALVVLVGAWVGIITRRPSSSLARVRAAPAVPHASPEPAASKPSSGSATRLGEDEGLTGKSQHVPLLGAAPVASAYGEGTHASPLHVPSTVMPASRSAASAPVASAYGEGTHASPLHVPSTVMPGSRSAASAPVASAGNGEVTRTSPKHVSRTASHASKSRAAAPAPALVASAEAAPGSLWIRVTPWAEVYLDGVFLGVTPLPSFGLPSGRHQVLLVNKDLQQHRTLPVEISAGSLRTLKVDLTAQ